MRLVSTLPTALALLLVVTGLLPYFGQNAFSDPPPAMKSSPCLTSWSSRCLDELGNRALASRKNFEALQQISEEFLKAVGKVGDVVWKPLLAQLGSPDH